MKRQISFCLAITVTFVFSADSGQATPPRYTTTDLGTLHGHYSIAHAINDAGIIVGESDRGAFLWDSKNGMTDLGNLGDGNDTRAWGISDSGKVTGYSHCQDGWKSFLWYKGKMTDLGSLGGHTKAYDINDAGVVVGRSIASDNKYHAFIWQPCEPIRDLGVIGDGKDSRAYAINDDYQVVGASRDVSGKQHAFLWDHKKGMRDIGKLEGVKESFAYAVNTDGQVAGASYNAEGICRAFLWDSESGLTDLGSLGDGRDQRSWSTGNAWEVVGDPKLDLSAFGGRHSGGKGINDAGDVVGYLYLADGSWHACLWIRSECMVDLNDLLPEGNPWKCLKEAFDINNKGQIVGYGITKNNQIHAFLMSPTIPASIAPDSNGR
jgi:probable HAF family extracellular repeat protein